MCYIKMEFNFKISGVCMIPFDIFMLDKQIPTLGDLRSCPSHFAYRTLRYGPARCSVQQAIASLLEHLSPLL